MPRGLKIGLSAWIVFHLCVVLIAPGGDSYLAQKVSPFLIPYTRFFEFTGMWGFFAPDPGPPPIYIEWSLEEKTGGVLETGRWPSQEGFFFRDRQNRRITSAAFMGLDGERAEKMLVPYLCRKNPRTESVSLWRVVVHVPSGDEVASGKRTLRDEVGTDRYWIKRADCGDFRS